MGVMFFKWLIWKGFVSYIKLSILMLLKHFPDFQYLKHDGMNRFASRTVFSNHEPVSPVKPKKIINFSEKLNNYLTAQTGSPNQEVLEFRKSIKRIGGLNKVIKQTTTELYYYPTKTEWIQYFFKPGIFFGTM